MGVLLKIIEYAKSGVVCENMSDTKEYFNKIIELAELEERRSHDVSKGNKGSIPHLARLVAFLLKLKSEGKMVFVNKYNNCLYLGTGGMLVKISNYTDSLNLPALGADLKGYEYLLENEFQKVHTSKQLSIDWLMPSRVQIEEVDSTSKDFRVGVGKDAGFSGVAFNIQFLRATYGIVGSETSGKYWVLGMRCGYFRSRDDRIEVLLSPIEDEGAEVDAFLEKHKE